MHVLRLKALISIIASVFMVVLAGNLGLPHAIGGATVLVGGWAGWSLYEFRQWYDAQDDGGGNDERPDLAE